MQIEFLAHASFLMTNQAGVRFMTDPYESGSFSGRVAYAPIDVSPDVIIITHDHADHSHTETIPGDFEVVRHGGRVHGVWLRPHRPIAACPPVQRRHKGRAINAERTPP